jgi:hypothetical protein
MKAGKYFIGDLCYVLSSKWDEVCDLTISGHECLEGKFTLSDGTEFAMFGTAHGDGYYYDQMGNSYPVDSGTIGCVLFDKIDDIDKEYLERSGTVLDIPNDFEVESEDGTIFVGPVTIYTDYEKEDQYQDF